MTAIKFRDDMILRIREGKKTVTRRAYKGSPCYYQVGRTYQAGDSDIRIRVMSIRLEPLYLVAEKDEVCWEGFSTFTEFKAVWEDIHGKYDRGNMDVYRIEFVVMATPETG